MRARWRQICHLPVYTQQSSSAMRMLNAIEFIRRRFGDDADCDFYLTNFESVRGRKVGRNLFTAVSI